MKERSSSQSPSQPFREIPSGFANRTLVTARLAGRLGMAAVRKAMDLKSASGDDETEQTRVAERLVATVGRMKGLAMKIGQMASYLDGSLPPGTQRVLARLQSESEPMAFDVIEQCLSDELGAPIADCFDAFDSVPIAAASIGQVHRARLGSDALAVKIQYPEVEKALKSDLDTIGGLLRLSTLGTAMSSGGLVAELRQRMLEECDYVAEADNQELFGQILAERSDVRVPTVLRKRSTRRVLTSQWMDGMSFQRFCEQAPQSAKDRAGKIIFEVCFTCIFAHALFNADPHPGNYLFERDGRVVLLDFGCVKKLDRELIEGWKQLAQTVLARDRRRFPDALTATGMVANPAKFDFDYQWRVFEYLYEPYLSTRPYTYTADYIRRSYDLMMWRNPNKRQADLPADWLLLNRLQWGLNSVLAQLAATNIWGDAFRQALEQRSTSSAEPVAVGAA